MFNLTPTSFTTKLEGGTYTAPPQSAQRIQDAQDGVTDSNGNKLGWDTPTQTYAMQLRLSNDAVVDAQGKALLTGNPSSPLFAQLVCEGGFQSLGLWVWRNWGFRGVMRGNLCPEAGAPYTSHAANSCAPNISLLKLHAAVSPVSR